MELTHKELDQLLTVRIGLMHVYTVMTQGSATQIKELNGYVQDLERRAAKAPYLKDMPEVYTAVHKGLETVRHHLMTHLTRDPSGSTLTDRDQDTLKSLQKFNEVIGNIRRFEEKATAKANHHSLGWVSVQEANVNPKTGGSYITFNQPKPY